LKFEEFDLEYEVLDGLDAMGFDEATPIQEQAIPVILEGRDLIGSAQTGTGKTGAFLIPIINRIISTENTNKIKALIIVPTRELAMQIDRQMEGLSYFAPVKSTAVYGGRDGTSFSNEKQYIQDGVEVLICTPGKFLVHLNLGYVDLSDLEFLVLDEADRMLDMGFIDDIMKIISYLPKKRQTLMFSATMPDKIRELSGKVLNNPFTISLSVSKPAENILQLAYVVYTEQKIPLVTYLAKKEKINSGIIFCSTKISAKQLAKELKHNGLPVREIHSDLEQSEREETLLDFRNRKISILVATDILSRGIDVDNIELIINFDVPHEGEDYIHRIGRTARADADGVAITLINNDDQRKFAAIEQLLGYEVHKMILPAQFGEAPEYNPKANKGRGGSGRGKPRNFTKRRK